MRERAPGTHPNAVGGSGKDEITIPPLLLGDRGGEGFFNGFRHAPKQLASLPAEGKNLAALVVERGKMAWVDSVI